MERYSSKHNYFPNYTITIRGSKISQFLLIFLGVIGEQEKAYLRGLMEEIVLKEDIF